MLLVVLLEGHTAVVERAQVVALDLLAPLLLEILLGLAPLVVLGLEALEDERDSDARVALETLDEVLALVAVDALDGLDVHGLRVAAERVVQAELGQLVGAHLRQLAHELLEHAYRAQIGLEHHVELEAFVLDAEDELLVLVLLRVDERRVLGPRGKRHVRGVEHLPAQLRLAAAHRLRVRADVAIGRAVLLARQVVDLERDALARRQVDVVAAALVGAGVVAAGVGVVDSGVRGGLYVDCIGRLRLRVAVLLIVLRSGE